MANNNGVISAPISLAADVYSVLGLEKTGDYYDVGYACGNSHGKINQWSLYKPVFYKTDKDLNIVKGAVAGDSGFTPQNAGSTNLVYKSRQEGDEDLFFRLSDFDGYDHNTENPFDIDDISYIGLGQASTGTYTDTATIPLRGIIKTLLDEGQFGLLGKWVDTRDSSLTGQTDYYYYNDIKDSASVDVAINITWDPDDHEDYYIREYKFYLATPALRTFTVDGWAITAQFGTILNAPTKNVEWVNFDDSFSLYTPTVTNTSTSVLITITYNTTDELPSQDYFDNFANNETVRVEYKLSPTDPEWRLYYYGPATYSGQTSSGNIYSSSFRRVASPPAIYALFYNGDIEEQGGSTNWYWRIIRNPDTM